MSEKPEALRLAQELYAFHAAKKEMPSVGGQMLGLQRYRIVASREAFSQILDAANKLLRQHTENERLRGLLLRIRAWDHLDGAADGSFWKREIDAAMGASTAPSAAAMEPATEPAIRKRGEVKP
jgi:hypothetical protein